MRSKQLTHAYAEQQITNIGESKISAGTVSLTTDPAGVATFR